MIDLVRFTQEKNVTAPFIRSQARIGRRIIKASVPDGWYTGKLGSKLSDVRPATLLERETAIRAKPQLLVYPIGLESVPFNFQNTGGKTKTITVQFQEAPAWEIVRVIKWEDGRYYYGGTDRRRSRRLVTQLKDAFDNNQNQFIQGTTPELKYYFILLSLHKQSLRAFQQLQTLNLDKEEMDKWISKFKQTFEGRLTTTIKDAGGELISYSPLNNNRYLVEWKTNEQKFKTEIKDDLRILDLGFCASNHDSEHTLASAIQLAKIFQEEHSLHITRR